MNTPHLRLALCLVLALALLSAGCNKLPGISKPPSAEGKWVLLFMELELHPGGKGTLAGMGTLSEITWKQDGGTVALRDNKGEPMVSGGVLTPDGQKIVVQEKNEYGDNPYWQRVR